MKKVIAFFIVMFLLSVNVSAASLCSYKEQTEFNGKAANVKAIYEAKEDYIEDESGGILEKYLEISILNITEEFYIVVKNDVNNEEKIYSYTDTKNGNIVFKWTELDQVTNFTIQIYTSEKTNCPEEKFKTLYLTLPRFNSYSFSKTCIENPDFHYCKEYVTYNEISVEKFNEEFNKYIEKDNDSKPNNNQQNNNHEINNKKTFDYKWIIIGGVSFVGATSYIIFRIKTKKQRELGL